MRLLAAIAVLVSLAGCVPNKPYRVANWPSHSLYPGCKIGAPSYTIETFQEGGSTREYGLAFIEFDDRGEMFDRCQLENVKRAIRDGKQRDPYFEHQDVVVVLFVHGWKNNASDAAGNVPGFRDALKQVVLRSGGRPVVGIYVGWRGAVVSAPLAKELTFWDRRDKARNLPRAHMSELLRNVAIETKGKGYTNGYADLITVGHSFGGAVLESAMTPILVDWVQSLEGDPDVANHAPADLVVYINQAAPAIDSVQTLEIMATQMGKVIVSHPSGQEVEVPIVLSVTSRGDSATKLFFPAGQTLSRPKNSLRAYPGGNAFGVNTQGELYFQTTANTKKLQSHVIGDRNSAEVKAAIAGGGKVWLEYLDQRSGTCYQFVDQPKVKNTTPYWVSQLPVEIVPDHSTIFTPEFVQFLSRVVVRVSRFQSNASTCAPPAAAALPPPSPPSSKPNPSPRVMQKR